MPSAVVVDSNVFISLLRQRVDPITTLGAWAGERDIATCGMIQFEVLRGIRTPKAKKSLSKFFNTLLDIPTTPAIWTRATEIAWKLDRKGIVIPASDALIAACTMQAGGTILSDDRHFDAIPGLTVLKPDVLRD